MSRSAPLSSRPGTAVILAPIAESAYARTDATASSELGHRPPERLKQAYPAARSRSSSGSSSPSASAVTGTVTAGMGAVRSMVRTVRGASGFCT